MRTNLPEPFHLLTKYLSEVNKGSALDIGAGVGQNSLFLAASGFKVEAIDIDEGLVSQVSELANKEGLGVKAKTLDIRDFEFNRQKYDLILAIQSLIFLRKSEFQRIISSIKNYLKPSGVTIISSFTTEDDSFRRFSASSKEVEKNTYLDSRTNQPWQFLDKNELRESFPSEEFEILFYDEKIVKDEPHAGVPCPHRHGIAMVVVKKKAED